MKTYVVRELLSEQVIVVHPSRYGHLAGDAELLIQWVQHQAEVRGTNFSIDVFGSVRGGAPLYFILITPDMGPTEFSFDPSGTDCCYRYDNGEREAW